ncbi:hypothetical protein JOB18_032249 [Solea senegalensis]|uniref:Uncharacterized protein n=1 Tax=Solea senegalensis TaxID=28829 RepID=A0AAV6SBE8_SOLSE|nr:hypothetical protein JOB18_032249 [Solea senegalensis]
MYLCIAALSKQSTWTHMMNDFQERMIAFLCAENQHHVESQNVLQGKTNSFSLMIMMMMMNKSCTGCSH